ncbi:NAD(P)H-binding protein [soil metagenome]
MKLLVIGASGGTGSTLVEQALAAKHDVLVLARKPETIKLVDNLSVQKGDVLDQDSIASAVQGCDAVLSTFGPASAREPGTLMSVGVRNILAACAAQQIKRFVFESGLMCSDGTGLGPFSRFGIKVFGAMVHKLVEDKRVAEREIQASALDWIIVRPPRLSHEPATGAYKHGVDAAINATKSLPHADVAAFMLRCASDASLVRTIQAIGF